MVQYKINLAGIANHKLIYEEDISDNREKGIDGIFVLESSSPLREDEEISGIGFHFITKQNDNVVCAKIYHCSSCKKEATYFAYSSPQGNS